MSGHLLYEVQKSVLSRLLADTVMISLVADRIFDNPPETAVFDYVSFGDHTAIPWNTKTDNGQQLTFVIHAWSRESSRAKLLQILKALQDSLQNCSLTVQGGTVTLCQWEYEDSRLDPDGKTWHGVQRYRLLASE